MRVLGSSRKTNKQTNITKITSKSKGIEAIATSGGQIDLSPERWGSLVARRQDIYCPSV